MSRIFISYRRADSAMATRLIYDRLAPQFGTDRVFMDINAIQLGVDFRQVIEDAVGSCDVLIAVIGDQWLTIADNSGRRRLDDPHDFVRLEIATALRRGIPVIPVLVEDEPMPGEGDLPDDLKELAWRNALALSHARFDADVARLIKALEQLLNLGGGTAPTVVESGATTPSTPARMDVLNLLPQPFEWIEIPAGRVRLEDRHGTFDTPAFAIAKYPVTNAQFDMFANDANGYQNAEWWDFSDQARAWRSENAQPRSTSLQGHDLPRTDVTWYEAVAYCRWLSDQTGENITLPTEVQWQRAAQGDDKREYPWGNTFDRDRCNTSESGVHGTSPVNGYPDGASPYEVLDMSGNVFEWCLNEYENPFNVGLAGDARRVVRGGSWMNGQSSARCTYRYGNYPLNRYEDAGFRIARIPIANG